MVKSIFCSFRKNLKSNSISIKKFSSYVYLSVLSLGTQYIAIGKYLSNEIISPHIPTATDSLDYVSRAVIWANGSFSEAFVDRGRMPGYPSVILLVMKVFPENFSFALRLINLLATTASTILIFWMLRKYVSTRLAFICAFIYCLLPSWYFVPILIAESLSSFIFVVLMALMIRIDSRSKKNSKIEFYVIGLLIACAIYLKPNNAIIAFFVLFSLRNKIRWIEHIRILITACVILAPWSAIGLSNGFGFSPLTTGSGVNMYVGTGMVLNYDGGVLANSAVRWKVDPLNNKKDLLSLPKHLSASEKDSIFRKKAIEIWKSRTWNQTMYGFNKVAIAFGLKSNSLRDFAYGLISLSFLVILIVNVLMGAIRFLAQGVLVFFICLTLQAFVFQADRRFVAPYIFASFAILLAFAIEPMKTRFESKISLRKSS